MMKLTVPDINTKYAVGIDFGHGETSFAYCALSWDCEIGQLEKPEDLRTEGNISKTLPSVYSIDKESGEMHIGSAGVDNIQYSKDFKISFKKRPSLMTENEKCKYTEFMRQVHILMQRMSGFNTGEYVVYICRPSGWNKTEDDLYLNMACNAGIPAAGIWPESRAAMINNALHGEAGRGDINQLYQGAILIDLGSSTVDLTYADEKMNFPIDDNGNDYGAQIVDMILYEYVLSLPENELARQMIADPNYPYLKDILLFACRKGKELFFTQRQYFTVNVPLNTYCSEDKDYFCGSFRCKREDGEKEFIYQLIETGLAHINKQINPSENISPTVCEAVNTGYHGKLKACLQDFLNKLEGQINCIILTGGASFMFLEEGNATFRNKILQGVIPNYDNILILIDKDPSTTVSRGIAQIGRNYARFIGVGNDLIQGLRDKIDQNIEAQIEKIDGQPIHDKITSVITDRIMGEVNLCFSRFEEGSTTTLQGLKSGLEYNIKNITGEIGSIVNSNIEIAKKEELNKAIKSISELTRLYTNKEPVLPDISAQIHLDKNIEVETDALDHAIDALSASAGEWLLAGIFYIVFAIVCYPIYLVSRLNPFGGTTKSFDEWFGNIDLDEDLMTREMSDAQRSKAYNRFKESESKTRSELYSKVSAALDHNDFQTKVKNTLSSVVDQYRKESMSVIKRIFI